jgi:hypothetical protein
MHVYCLSYQPQSMWIRKFVPSREKCFAGTSFQMLRMLCRRDISKTVPSVILQRDRGIELGLLAIASILESMLEAEASPALGMKETLDILVAASSCMCTGEGVLGSDIKGWNMRSQSETERLRCNVFDLFVASGNIKPEA